MVPDPFFGYGLALCKNAHWLFDNGLWTLTDDYKVIVAAGEFAEAGTGQDLLAGYHGKKPKKGSGTICAQHPSGRSGKWCLTPF
jgi:hypothetical protein